MDALRSFMTQHKFTLKTCSPNLLSGTRHKHRASILSLVITQYKDAARRKLCRDNDQELIGDSFLKSNNIIVFNFLMTFDQTFCFFLKRTPDRRVNFVVVTRPPWRVGCIHRLRFLVYKRIPARSKSFPRAATLIAWLKYQSSRALSLIPRAWRVSPPGIKLKAGDD